MRKPSSGTSWLAIGSLFVVVGIINIVMWFVFLQSATPVEGESTGDGALQALVVWAAALFLGAGLVLVAMGYIKKKRFRMNLRDDSSQR
ncbi:MAG: hypothetical protein JWP30_800 [Homoserinimonas sp.]|nr:hypothetical protein [Homoserinimonas sp.]